MSDEKLHPEVEALIASGPQEHFPGFDAVRETTRDFAYRIALLAASKAREEQREEDAGIAFVNRHWDAVRIAAAIRRGKP